MKLSLLVVFVPVFHQNSKTIYNQRWTILYLLAYKGVLSHTCEIKVCRPKRKKNSKEIFFFWFLHPKLDVRFSSWEEPSRFRMAYKQEMIDSIYQKPKVWLNILCFKEKTFLLEQFWVKKSKCVLILGEQLRNVALFEIKGWFYLFQLKIFYALLYLLEDKAQ